MRSRLLVLCAAFVPGLACAVAVTLPGGVLTVPGNSATGVSFTYSGTLTQSDTIALVQSGSMYLQCPFNAYYVNGAGVLITPCTTPVGSASYFAGPRGVIPVGTWTYGALLMQISSVGTVQVFPTNAANGLGSSNPPWSLTLPSTTLGALGFGTFSLVNPTITFIVADTSYPDNGGGFVLTQPFGPTPAGGPIPTLRRVGDDCADGRAGGCRRDGIASPGCLNTIGIRRPSRH